MSKLIFCISLLLVFLLNGCAPSTSTDNNDTQAEISSTTTDATTADITTTTTPHNITTTTATDTNRNTESMHFTTTMPMLGNPSVTSTTTKHSGSNHTDTLSSTTVSIQPATTTFKATVRDSKSKQPVCGVTVTVYTDGNSSPAGSGITDNNGIARITLTKGSSYRVVLSTLPSGYEADAEYRFATTTVNIAIRKAATRNEQDHSSAQYEIGDRMTDFALTDTDGNNYRLSDLLKEKKLVILDFWFANCQPCKSEFPYFESAVQKYADQLALLAVNPIDSSNTILSLRNQYNENSDTAITFPMLQDTCKLYLGFEVSAYPTTVLIDENGVIQDIHIGAFPSEEAFISYISQYLN